MQRHRDMLIRLSGCLICVATAGMHGAAAQTGADATLIPKGLVRIEFAPLLFNYDSRFAFGSNDVSDGTLESLGVDFTAEEAGSFMFPALEPSEQAVAAIIGDQNYRMSIGAFRTVRDADIRHFPFQLSLGLTDRITVSAKVPIVTHRMQVTFTTADSTANVGYNLANTTLGDATTAAAAAAVVFELTAAITELTARISSGDFGCPSSPECAIAQGLLVRATTIRDNLTVLTGPESPATGVASFAPLATSPAGMAFTSTILTVANELAALGVSTVSTLFPLPTDPVNTDDVQALLTDPTLGYAAGPLEFIRGTSIGDAEVSLRLGLVQSAAARVVLTGTVRLPTGKTDLAGNFLDLGTGDAQADVIGGLELVLGGRAAQLAVGGTYTLQLSNQLARRIGPPDRPILPLSSETIVTRNLGDVIWVSAHPSIRLSDIFTVYGTVSYYRKGEDRFSNPTETASLLFPVESLNQETSMRALSFGGGIAYRTSYTGDRMPIEAGLSYQSTFSGSGGMTPKANVLNLYLRLFYNLFAPRSSGT